MKHKRGRKFQKFQRSEENSKKITISLLDKKH